MVRSLWSAATGMNAQQTNVDTIANNLANVNTVGYKSQVAQFKSLLYQTLQTATTTANGDPKPTTSQVGLGVRNSSINSIFTQGSLLSSNSDTAFAIEGDGYFAIQGSDGNTYYTRNGDFTWATNGRNGMILTNQDGLPVLSSTGRTITLNANYVTARSPLQRMERSAIPMHRTILSHWELPLECISLIIRADYREKEILCGQLPLQAER